VKCLIENNFFSLEYDILQNVVKFSHDGSFLATGGEDGAVRIWKLSIPNLNASKDVDDSYRNNFKAINISTLEGHAGCISGIAWHPSNKLVCFYMTVIFELNSK